MSDYHGPDTPAETDLSLIASQIMTGLSYASLRPLKCSASSEQGLQSRPIALNHVPTSPTRYSVRACLGDQHSKHPDLLNSVVTSE